MDLQADDVTVDLTGNPTNFRRENYSNELLLYVYNIIQL